MEGNASEQQNVNIGCISTSLHGLVGLPALAHPRNVRIAYPTGSSGSETRHYTNAYKLVHDHEHLKAANAALSTALHAAGQELGEARREEARWKHNFANEQQASAEAIRTLRVCIEELKRRNENQAGLIAFIRAHEADSENMIKSLAHKLADAEQRIAGMEADLAAISADEEAGDEILGDRVEFKDVDTYSELATEAVRLADEVQDLKAHQSKAVVWLVIDEEAMIALEEKAHRLESSLCEVTSERDKLRGELEVERMRLTACDVAARANTRESAANTLARTLPKYHSAALDSVVRAVEREMNWRERAKKLEGELGLERLKSDMERTRARLAERMAFCARALPAGNGALTVGVDTAVPPPQTPVTATAALDERSKRDFWNSTVKVRGTPAGHPYTFGVAEFIRRLRARGCR